MPAQPVPEWFSNLPALLYNFLPVVEGQLLRGLSQLSAKREIMRRGRRYSCALILLAALAVSFAVSPAHAHAVLLESTPALKSSVTGPNVPIKLRFNVRIDALRSRLTLIHPDGSAQALEISKQTPADTLSAEATGLAAGAYRLRWQVLASDGHITRGEIPFTVTAS
jgi:methionine-rich copper-binding protein CopC